MTWPGFIFAWAIFEAIAIGALVDGQHGLFWGVTLGWLLLAVMRLVNEWDERRDLR